MIALKLLLAGAASLAAVLILMPHWIDYLKKLSFNQSVSEYSLEEYKEKAKTPIMGGVLFIVIPILVTILFDPKGAFALENTIVLLTFLMYGLIGFIDDFLIVIKHNNDGLSPWQKFGMQIFMAIVFYVIYRNHADLAIHIPFTDHAWVLGGFYGVLILFMFAGSSNAVNLTDGMDGLAAGCMTLSLIPFLVFCLQQSKFTLATFICALEGALLGYLHFNVKPARIFMGDTGSLALGAVLAALAMVTKKELALIVIGGVFVIETLCVIIQISSVKLRHKKVFPYTPIHYAFVIKGMGERQVVHLFWLAAFLFMLAGLWVGLN